MTENLYFNGPDSSELTDRIFKLILSAKKYIKTGNFFFKDPKIKNALLDAADRGVAIFVISNLTGNERRTTKEEADPHIPHLHELERNGVHVRICRELHAKFLIIDGTEGLIMSANYTPDSLYANPENGVDVVDNELSDLELIFDTMYLNPDVKLSGDKNIYSYKDYNNKINPDIFKHIGVSSRIRLTAASDKTPNYSTNLSECHHISIYETILKIIRESKSAIIIVSWSYNRVKDLPELKEELQRAIDRGVSVFLFYGNKGALERIEKTKKNIEELLGDDRIDRATQFTDNHAKCIISEKEGLLFTANIDGNKGLLRGFELGCVLTDAQRKQSIKRLSQLLENGN